MELEKEELEKLPQGAGQETPSSWAVNAMASTTFYLLILGRVS